MNSIFLLLFGLQWPPFIGQLQAISKLGSPCEREEDFINGGVASSMDGQRRQPGEGLEAFKAPLQNILVPSSINVLGSIIFSIAVVVLRGPAPSRVCKTTPAEDNLLAFCNVLCLEFSARGSINAWGAPVAC